MGSSLQLIFTLHCIYTVWTAAFTLTTGDRIHESLGDSYGYILVWRSGIGLGRNWRTADDLALRSMVTNRALYWPGAVVPYTIDNRFNEFQRNMILKAMDYFHQISCVRWVPAQEGTRNYVHFEISDPDLVICVSMIGMVGGRQKIHLHPDCFTFRYDHAVEHEMMHVLGFIHTHERLDRDCYIWIRDDKKDSWSYSITKEPHTIDIPYDFSCVMHYAATEFMRGWYNETLGPPYPQSLTGLDKWQLNSAYCNKIHYCKVYPKSCAEVAEYRKRCT